MPGTQRARVADPQTQALAEALTQWHDTIGDQGVSVKRAIEYATKRKQKTGNEQPKSGVDLNAPEPPEFENPDFREALIVVAGDHGAISSLRLGKYLSRNMGRIINGLRIEQDVTVAQNGVVRWKVIGA